MLSNLTPSWHIFLHGFVQDVILDPPVIGGVSSCPSLSRIVGINDPDADGRYWLGWAGENIALSSIYDATIAPYPSCLSLNARVNQNCFHDMEVVIIAPVAGVIL